MDKQKWIEEVRMYLNEEYTQHLYRRSLETEDVEKLKNLITKAKKIWAVAISEADQIINQSKNL